MGVLRQMFDGLTSLMSGLGTSADRRSYQHYAFMHLPLEQVESAYRTSWLMRQIIDIPAIDMTKAWREWDAEPDVIAALEAEEKRLQLQHKIKRAVISARLWGGSALVIGANDSDDPTEPLDPKNITEGGLEFLTLFARNQISAGQLDTDPMSPFYLQPKSWNLGGIGGHSQQVHPSRVIPFIANPAPEGSLLLQDTFWGDPVMASIQNALKNADVAQDGFGALIEEAKIDVIKVPGLMKNIASEEYETKLLNRLQAAQSGKSMWRALVLDGGEEWDQKSQNWGGVTNVLMAYMQIIAGAADIPVTRLLGASPTGLASTGEGEERDYQSMIESRQEEIITPALDRLDEVMVRSALGEYPDDLAWKWNPLKRMTEMEAAEVEERRSKTIKAYADTGLLDGDALAKIAANAMSQSGNWPGAEEAFREAEEMEAEEPSEEELEGVQLGSPDPLEEVGAFDQPTRRILMDGIMQDGISRPLYVSRKVVNAREIIRHFEDQGISPMLQPDDLHVTIIYSKTAVDWLTIDPDWSVSGKDATWTIPPGGPRQMLSFGPEGRSLVLGFKDNHLEWRHKVMLDAGATCEHSPYQPHITLSNEQEPLSEDELMEIEPWQGPIVLGPEIFAEARSDWKERTVET